LTGSIIDSTLSGSKKILRNLNQCPLLAKEEEEGITKKIPNSKRKDVQLHSESKDRTN